MATRKKESAVYFKGKEKSKKSSNEKILAFWKQQDKLLSEREIWLAAARALKITDCGGEIGERFMTDGYYNLELRQYWSLKNSQTFIRDYEGTETQRKELKLKKDAAYLKIEKMIEKLSDEDRQIILHDVQVQKKVNAFFAALASTTKALEKKVQNYGQSSTYVANYYWQKRKEAKRDKVIKKVELLLADFSTI